MAKARIFVVEDEVVVAEMLKMNLERNGYEIAGHEIYGEAVVEAVARSRPDLILMDIRLKGKMDGISAAIQVGERYDIPIIYLTAYGDAETLERAKQTSPFGYLIKPFELETLRSTIETALNKHDLERRLAASEARLGQIIEQMPYPIVVFTPEGVATRHHGQPGSIGNVRHPLRRACCREIKPFTKFLRDQHPRTTHESAASISGRICSPLRTYGSVGTD